MFIRAITLQGFKSFPDKVSVDLSAGIAAVVGPNGCGKSNVLDALRWVFGSQSPKQMRGASMQDVIFSGTARRPQSGFAEVTVIFDNESRRAPEPWRDAPEVAIRRRVDRGGEGEYRINGARVRLRDVQEFLMDVGYGEYSIVQQGSIGQLVQARPEDVRIFIEQASRMTKFRARREDAQNKLARTEENLERVLDLLQEVERQMNSLKRQADKAEKALAIEAELRAVSAHLLARQLKADEAQAAEVERELKALGERIAAARTQIAQADADQSELHERQGAIDQAFEALLSEQRELQEARAAHTNRLSALSNECALREEERTAAAAESERLQAALAEITTAREALRPAVDEAQAAFDARAEALKALDERLTAARTQRGDLSARQAALQHELVAGMRQEVETRSQLNRAEMAAEHARERLGQLSEQRQAAAARRDRARADSDRLQQDVSQAEAARDQAQQRFESAGAALQRAQQDLHVLERQQREAQAQLQDERIELDRIVAALRAQEVVVELPEGAQGAVRVPWDRLAPKPEADDLAETILAERFQALVVDAPEVAHAIWRAAQDEGQERRVRWFVADRAVPAAAAAPAGCTPAHALLDYEERDAAWVEALTAGIWVRNEPLDPEQPLPTGDWQWLWDRRGTCVSRDGLWSAGPLSDRGTAHLAARRAALRDSLSAREANVAELGEQAKSTETVREQAQAAREQSAADLDARRRAVGEVGHELKLALEVSHRAEAELQQVEADAARLDEAAARAAAEHQRARETLDGLLARLDQLRRDAAQVEAELSPLEAAHQQLEAERQAAALGLDEARDALGELRRRGDTLGQDEAHHRTRLQQLDDQSRRALVRLEEAAAEQASLRTQVEALNEQLFATGKKLEEQQRHQTEFRNHAIEIERKLREGNQSLEGLLQQQANRERLAQELSHRMQSSREAFAQRFGAPFAVPDGPDERSDDELATIAGELGARRDRLGAINPAALEEYAEAKERFEAMSTQREDLLTSIERLRESIRRMNRESRERFKTAFETVNMHFGEIFAKLMKGGHAELRLSDPDDWLESGVEIVARPPGSNIQRLELLSGGQKAMTAISLILAIFMTHPSPFCILDEVDAPLDDANIARFNQVIVELNELAQILLVTHNKHTMEIADTLYGITMEERGVSKAIAVRLT